MSARRRRLPRVRSIAGVMCIWAGISALLLAVEAPSSRADANPMALFGAGTPNIFKQLTGWQNDMLGASQPIDVNYIGQLSGPLARQDFVHGSYDYIISGTAFSTDQQAQLKSAGVSVIEAPVQVTAAVLVMLPPTILKSDGTVTWALRDMIPGTPAGCGTRVNPCATPPQFVDYNGPLRLPQRALAELLLGTEIDTKGNLQSFWQSPQVLGSMTYGTPPTPLHGLNYIDVATNDFSPATINRSEPSDDTYYLESAAVQIAPEVWASAQSSGKVGSAPSERRIEYVLTRPGVFTPVSIIGSTFSPLTNKSYHAGIDAFLPPSSVADGKASFPNTPVMTAQLPNGNGEWVAPTPDSISAAIAAGHGAPLFGLKEAVSGVYPLAWINNLYVRASGLSIDKTNAIAGLLRYLATDGQNSAGSFGEGHLSPELVTKALKAADQVVSSNCTGTDRVVIEARSAAPYAPDGPALGAALSSYGPVLQCAAPPAPPTTTTVAPTTTAAAPTTTMGAPTTITVGASTTVASTTTATGVVRTTTTAARPFTTRLSVPATRPIATTLTPTAGPSTSATPTTAPPAPPPTSTMSPSTVPVGRTAPLPIPLKGSVVGGFDRVTTALLGGGLVLVGRLLLRRRAVQRGPFA